MKIFNIVCLCILSATVGLAQNAWHSIPTVAPGPHEPDLVGATVDAVAIRGKQESKARIVLSAARNWGTPQIGIWVDGLFRVIPETQLWPYMGPDLGPAALNPRMIEITLAGSRGKVRFNSRMIMLSAGNFPEGVADRGELLFATNGKINQQFKSFLRQMNAGFDHGTVRIGQGVFSPPMEIKFRGEGVEGRLNTVIDSF